MAAQLKQLTQYYEFGDILEQMLRDRLVCGIADVRMQRALLAEPQLTFTKALQMIQTMETADRDSRVTGTNTRPSSSEHSCGQLAGNWNETMFSLRGAT